MRPSGKEGILCSHVGLTDETHCMDSHLEFFAIMPGAQATFAIEIDKWPEALEAATDDRHHQGKAKCTGACEGFRRTADANPDWKPRLMWTRKDALPFEWRTKAAFPGDISRLAELEKQIELFGEKLVIMTRIQPE